MLQFLPDSGHMTDGFNRQALHLRILRASLIVRTLSGLLEWLQTPTHSAGLAVSGVLPLTPERVCATIVRIYNRSREPEELDAFLATAEADNPGFLTDVYLDVPGATPPAGLTEDEQGAWLHKLVTCQVKDDCDDDVLDESVGRFCMHCQ